MTGLKMTTMTIKEMRAAHERGESKTDLEFLHHNQLVGLEPEDDEDAPDASVVMREQSPNAAPNAAPDAVGRGKKEQVAIRFDQDVLEVLRSTGGGWQIRMNDALKAWLKEHLPDKSGK